MITKWLFISKWFSMLSISPFSTGRSSSHSNDVLLGTVHARPFSLPIEQHQQIRSRFGIKRFTFQPLNFGIVLVVVGYSAAKPHVVSSCCWLMHLHHQIQKNDQYLHELQGKSPISVDNSDKCPNFSRQDLFLGMINPPFSPARHVPRTKPRMLPKVARAGNCHGQGSGAVATASALANQVTACNNSQRDAEIVALIIILMACVLSFWGLRHKTTNLVVSAV